MKAALLTLLLIASLATPCAADSYQRPTAEEALAFLQSLPPIARNINGTKQMVNIWKEKTADDIRTMKEIAPGGHVPGGDHLRIEPEDWRYFTAFTNLETAKLYELHGANDRAFYHLGHLSQSVKYLFVELGELSDDGVRHLQNLKNLEFLGIGWTKTVTDGMLEPMAGIASLKEILVSGCRGIQGPGVAHLAKLKTLKILKIADTSLTDDSLTHLSRLTMEELDLSQNKITFGGLKALLGDAQSLPNLKSLTLKKVNLSAADLAALREMRPGLRILN